MQNLLIKYLNSVNSDQKPADQDQHCLPFTLKVNNTKQYGLIGYKSKETNIITVQFLYNIISGVHMKGPCYK